MVHENEINWIADEINDYRNHNDYPNKDYSMKHMRMLVEHKRTLEILIKSNLNNKNYIHKLVSEIQFDITKTLKRKFDEI